MKILIATSNTGKIAEIKSLLSVLDIEIVTPSDVGLSLEVAETGSTYLENALLKANVYSQESNLLTLADDTGLEVAALNGIPGIHSARFINDPHATDKDRRSLLLSKLQPHARPWKARFVCAAVLMRPGEAAVHALGECQGEIIPQERGEHGFGYDAIFLVDGTHKTMAELTMEEKNSTSHRAKAVKALFPFIG
ncbi:MAG TPA: non-canonical purine NTP pyrophosphatase, RdgB/HAM1 family [Anaerolineaceae bacterium]|uniref:dITP/XTP pyrophosphatase n=1 Tax=Anaerolinea thermophila TaxID=167964 RepID=A0A101FYF6_9CHLR|nr:MAG: Non-canonical purine NTP pyrophosphatase [Anaerolinea thermophila]HAF60975.1 non-canonical purine NTP pyrophosphatase, RdgB/HAM1 family [Anaerolineaceae bacterium]